MNTFNSHIYIGSGMAVAHLVGSANTGSNEKNRYFLQLLVRPMCTYVV